MLTFAGHALPLYSWGTSVLEEVDQDTPARVLHQRQVLVNILEEELRGRVGDIRRQVGHHRKCDNMETVLHV